MIFSHPVFAENLNIQSLSISIDKNSKVSIFKNEVIASDEKNTKQCSGFYFIVKK